MTPEGKAVVVWQQQSDMGWNWDVRVKRYDANWTGGTTLNISSVSSIGPEVAVDDDGNAIVAWGSIDVTPQSVYVSRFDAANSTWSAGTTISGNSQDAVNPRVSVAPGGDGLVVWMEAGDIMARRYDGVLDQWQPFTTVDDPNQFGAAEEPRVGIDDTGAAVVVWRQPFGSYKSVWANRAEPGGTFMQAQAQVIGSGNVHLALPELAVDPAGNAFVVWRTYDYNGMANFDIWAARYDEGSGMWSNPQVIDAFDGTADFPRVAVDPSGNAIVVWQQIENGVRSILANRYDAGSGDWGLTEGLETASEAASLPRVAMDAAGNAVAVWMQSDGTSESVYANRYLVASNAWQGRELVETAAGDVLDLDVAVSAGGVAIVVWSQQQSITNIADIYASVLE